MQETEAEVTRRSAALEDAQKTVVDSRAWKGEDGAVAGEGVSKGLASTEGGMGTDLARINGGILRTERGLNKEWTRIEQ